MSVHAHKYIVITPVRDEEAYLRFTIESMLAQTIHPCEWVIVNDGSTDDTAAIIDEYAAQHPWIRAVHRVNRGFRKAGGGVVEAFNDGLRAASADDWGFLVKMDGDLTFEPTYFERCLERFERDPRLGIGGGVICYIEDGAKRFEFCPEFHVRGATKIYRRECWDAIGGFWPAPGWAPMEEGGAKKGRANYICGYHPLFMVAKCFHRLPRRPYVIGSIALFYGFITGYLKQIPQANDVATIDFLRRQQLGRLWGRQTIWR